MSEGNTEPEALPSTSKIVDSQKTAIFPLVSMPKIVLTRVDLGNLPIPVYLSPMTTKKPLKRLNEKKNKPLESKTKNTVSSIKRDTRFRGKPKKNYKMLSEMGTSSIEPAKSKIKNNKIGSIVKKVSKLTAKAIEEDENNTVKGMLKKTMLQKRSKVAIPPAKKPKLMPTKPSKSNTLSPKVKKEKTNTVAPTPKKEISPKTKEFLIQSKQMDTYASEDDFLYDELIDELVNSPQKKVLTSEKTTNITLKPNVGNKPPTIVKGGIVKKSSLPPDLKSMTSPTTLNSSKLAITALSFNSKQATVENVIKTPDTAETPNASLPSKASPFPIAINSSKTASKGQGKKSPDKLVKSTSIAKEDPLLNLNTPQTSSKQIKAPQKPKSSVKSTAPTPKPKGRPKMGPKTVMKVLPTLSTAAEDESDEYTEVETLENVDSEPVERMINITSNPDKNEDIQVETVENSKRSAKSDVSPSFGTKSNDDDDEEKDPHLDLLRILTDDTEDVAQPEPSEVKTVQSENLHNSDESWKPNTNFSPDPPISSDSNTPKKVDRSDSDNADDQEADKSSFSQNHELSTVKASEGPSDNVSESSSFPKKIVEEVTSPVRTIYDLMSEVSLQYPSWNLHIIPETNAFCIAQVTKGRLGLPTLKKCIELDPDTYNAKVYIHQYHIKRFDGVYDSEEAILALIEEIHSIKA